MLPLSKYRQYTFITCHKDFSMKEAAQVNIKIINQTYNLYLYRAILLHVLFELLF